jgi:DNA-binding response OmpR family regulator
MSDLDLTGHRILLVEDEYLIARSLGVLLGIWGATVLGPASTIERALGLLAKTDGIDFALVDINLRGVAAFPVADALLARGVPFAFTTGYGTSMIPEHYRDVAALQKPFDAAALAKALLILTS